MTVTATQRSQSTHCLILKNQVVQQRNGLYVAHVGRQEEEEEEKGMAFLSLCFNLDFSTLLGRSYIYCIWWSILHTLSLRKMLTKKWPVGLTAEDCLDLWVGKCLSTCLCWNGERRGCTSDSRACVLSLQAVFASPAQRRGDCAPQQPEENIHAGDPKRLLSILKFPLTVRQESSMLACLLAPCPPSRDRVSM